MIETLGQHLYHPRHLLVRAPGGGDQTSKNDGELPSPVVTAIEQITISLRIQNSVEPLKLCPSVPTVCPDAKEENETPKDSAVTFVGASVTPVAVFYFAVFEKNVGEPIMQHRVRNR